MSKLVYKRVDRRNPESCHLYKHYANVNSQAGEDGIIARILELIGTKPETQWCVEFGAWDGKHLSNTYNLINNKNYKGVLIEGSSERFRDLQATYGSNPNAYCVHRLVSFEVGPDSLDSIFAETSIPLDFDLISIDIDGNDYYVWEGLVKYRPRIVVIEFNGTVPNDVVFVQQKDFSINQGCSLLALIELGREKGYELASVTTCNGIFVRSEEFDRLGIADNSIDAMHMPLFEGKIFQGFDGTLFNVGLEKMQWTLKRAAIGPMHFQVISDARRRFADSIIDRRAREEAADRAAKDDNAGA